MLIRFLTLLLCTGVVSNGFAQHNASHKPNILWITIEDTSPHFIGCYGNKVAKTPHIDKLAAEGVRFTNAFSTGTVCSPSRTALITGVKTYEAGTGNHRSNYVLPDEIRGFPFYLKQAGYYTSNNQKTDYNVANEKQFIQTAWHESSGTAGWHNRMPGQPFFAVFNFMDTHQSRTMTETYKWYEQHVLEKLRPDERIGDDEFEVPPFFNDSPEMRKHLARVYNSIKLTDNQIGDLLRRLDEDHLRDSTIIFFFADHGEGIPRGKTNGINLGYRVPFVIWFPEMYKHLSPWGSGGVVTDELVDFTDLAPTMLNLAGVEIPSHLKGRKMLGDKRSKTGDHLVLSSDRSDNGIDMIRTVTDGRFVYSRNFMPFTPELRYIRYMEIGEIKQQMREDLKNGKLNTLQKRLFDPRPPEFLFDVRNDPFETRNLANDPAYAATLKKMRSRLKDEVIASRDVMFLPEYELGLIKPTPYQFRQDKKKYPIEKIWKVASMSGFRGHETAREQVGLLDNPDKIVRYWAVLGLRSQDGTVLKQYEKEIANAIRDAYPPVSIIASAIAYEQFKNEEAAEVLKKYCMGENESLTLMAIHYLLYTSDKQPFVETVRSARAREGASYNVKAACVDFLGSMGLIPNNPSYRE